MKKAAANSTRLQQQQGTSNNSSINNGNNNTNTTSVKFVEEEMAPKATPTAPTASSSSTRIVSLDFCRGFSMAMMFIVDQGYTSTLTFLNHTQWNSVSVADLVMPLFLFIAGASVAFSTGRQVLKMRKAQEEEEGGDAAVAVNKPDGSLTDYAKKRLNMLYHTISRFVKVCIFSSHLSHNTLTLPHLCL